MRYLNNFEFLFYIGVAFIIAFYVEVLLGRFEDERFDFHEHKWIALTYTVLMLLTIVLWRYIFDIVLNPRLIELLGHGMEVE